MTFIDSNASFGNWPFASLPCRTLDQFEVHLRSNQIDRALVSRLETIFLPDPDRINREHIQACKDHETLIPLPVLNLSNIDWMRNLEDYRTEADIKAVKLYPNFHNYLLSSKRVSELVDYLAAEGIRLIINIRMVDERHQYHGLKIKGVSEKQIIAFAKRFPDIPFLCTGLYRDEIVSLAKPCPNLHADLSFADWHDLINGLIEVIEPERLHFGSHTPLMVTKANTYKLETSRISSSLKTQIARKNAKAFFNL